MIKDILEKTWDIVAENNIYTSTVAVKIFSEIVKDEKLQYKFEKELKKRIIDEYTKSTELIMNEVDNFYKNKRGGNNGK